MSRNHSQKLIGTLVALASLMLVPNADAKVFSYGQKLAAYFRGGAMFNQLGQDAFVNASGTQTVFDKTSSPYNAQGEFGFLYNMGSLNMRIGIEVLRPKEVEITGNSAASVPQFTLTSSIFAYSPMLSFEYIYSALGETRFFFLVSAGYAVVSVDNDYVLTAAGLGTYSPVTSHIDKMAGTSLHGEVGLGLETFFTDNVTFSLDFGYRQFEVTNLKYTAPVTTFGPKTVAKGDTVTNADGSARKLDLGGITANAAFRFYLNF